MTQPSFCRLLMLHLRNIKSHFVQKLQMGLLKRAYSIQNIKALEYTVAHMDCNLVDISEAFGGARIGYCDIKPTDGATIFASEID